MAETPLFRAWPAVRAAVRRNAWVLALVALAFVLGMAASRLLQPHEAPVVQNDPARPPSVEPLELRKVDRETAQAINAKVPFVADAIVAAKPFIFKGPPDDFARATDCLAAAIFYEAGAEKLSGQMAVAQVVLNRARHPAYPSSVCGVVFQGQERRTGCQFTFTCDGSLARRPSPAAWSGYRQLAQSMLKGLVHPGVGLATHYHTDWVVPLWSSQLEKIHAEGTHLFFRYAGFWGTPGAFRGNATVPEPAIAKLAGLSPAHAGAAPVTDEASAAAIVQTPADQALLDPRVSTEADTSERGKEVFLITVDPLLESGQLSTMAEGICRDRPTCKVFAWTDPALMPRGLPLDAADRSSMVFSYLKGAGGKPATQRWNCELFPRESGADCMGQPR